MVAVVALVVGVVLLRARSTPVREMWLPDNRLPDSAAVCRDALPVDCASAAARRLGQPVAWIAPAEDADRVGLYVVQEEAFEEFISGEAAITVYSNPSRPAPNWAVIGNVERGAVTGEVRLDNEYEGLWLVSVEWWRDGRRFLLTLSFLSEDQAAVLRNTDRWFKQVQYADPGT